MKIVPVIWRTSPQELTYIIKQDIAHLNKQIASLQAYVKQRNAGNTSSVENKQVEEHTNNVVMLLQSKLANTSVTFKDVLEVRTQVRCMFASISGFFLLMQHTLEHEGIENTDRTIYV